MMHFQPLFDNTRFEIHYNLERQSPAITGDMKRLADLYHDQFQKAWSKKSNRDAFMRGFIAGFSSLLTLFNDKSYKREEFTQRHSQISAVITRSYANCERLAIRHVIAEHHLDEREIFTGAKHKQWMEMDSFPEWDRHFNAVQRFIIGKPGIPA